MWVSGGRFLNSSFARVFSSPDESGVTSKTPRKPTPKRRGGGQKYLKAVP